MSPVAGDPVWPDLIDPAGQRLCSPVREGLSALTCPAATTSVGASEVGPWPLRITAYDLTAGRETGRVAVPGVFAGSWQLESVDGTYVGLIVHPPVALSPDGRTNDASMRTLDPLAERRSPIRPNIMPFPATS